MKRILILATMAIAVLTVSCNGQSQKTSTEASKKSKKVLVISSSPSKGGNSDLLCDEFLKGAQVAGHKGEKVFLGDLDIRFLKIKDDYSDRNLGINDDAPKVVAKMIEADVIVMATPIYNDNMCGQMKTMLDRVFEREREVSNKEFYFIMTAGGRNTECALLGFRNFIHYLPGSQEKGVIEGTGIYPKGAVKDKPVMKEAYEMGKNV
ncbi:flavodoxin family protein [Bacteroides reticulotermitis]|uniref:flavodoxin family protein n=1 Tax=Bacteroides reticulotermitis TaxID=1133319 RepID=UPI003A83772D